MYTYTRHTCMALMGYLIVFSIVPFLKNSLVGYYCSYCNSLVGSIVLLLQVPHNLWRVRSQCPTQILNSIFVPKVCFFVFFTFHSLSSTLIFDGPSLVTSRLSVPCNDDPWMEPAGLWMASTMTGVTSPNMFLSLLMLGFLLGVAFLRLF